MVKALTFASENGPASDAKRGPRPETKSGGELRARAARGLRSHSKIAPQESPHTLGLMEAAKIE